MKFRKLAALVCAAAISVSMLAGCKDDKNNEDIKPTETTVSTQQVSGSDMPSVFGDRDAAATAESLMGNWAYIHDTENPVLAFSINRNAIFEGKLYTYDCDGDFINLTDENGNVKKMRFVLDKDGMYLFKSTTYEFTGEGKPDGLIGVWECKEQNWSFEFTKMGTFREDAYFPGYYTVDEAASTFKLIYNDHFEDTTCYYQLDGNKLTIEYPWRMVKVG